MFNYGMKVTVYSERKAAHEDVGWHRSCTDISYFKNTIRKDQSSNRYFYTATFTYTFEYADDSVFFSYCYPYTYSDLTRDIGSIEENPDRRKFLQRGVLCKTLAGVECPLLTITSPNKKKDAKA
jgi:cytosolic carboxypeptidase protein 2/3